MRLVWSMQPLGLTILIICSKIIIIKIIIGAEFYEKNCKFSSES